MYRFLFFFGRWGEGEGACARERVKETERERAIASEREGEWTRESEKVSKRESD